LDLIAFEDAFAITKSKLIKRKTKENRRGWFDIDK
jgi:hypothetical protein